MSNWREIHLTGNLTFFIREYIVTTAFIIAICAGVCVAVASDLNIVAAMIQVFGGALVVFALVSPKSGMYLLILAAGYLDLIKRLMVVTGQVAIGDVAWVLAVAPVIFLAVTLGLIIHRIFAHRIIEKGETLIVLVIAILIAASVAIAQRDAGLTTQGMQQIANSGGYVPLLLVMGVLFPTLARTKRFLRYTCLVLIPVPLYAIWQFFFGLTQFEYRYMRSGLTITEGSLDDLHPRAFSTLASAHPLTMVCAILFFLSLIPVRRNLASWFPFTNWRWILIAATFLCGSLASLARIGWLAIAMGLFALGCFWSRKLTKILYVITGVTFFLVVVNADWIESHVDAMQELLPMGSDSTEMAFRLGTIGDRLIGWKNILSHPQEFGAFGVPFAERTEDVYVHDQIGQILVNSGYVGLLVAISAAIFAIVKAHQLTWKVRDPDARRLALFCLAIIFGVVGSGAILGGSVTVYPVNLLFWLSAGVLIQVLRLDRNKEGAIEKTGEAMAGGLHAGMAANPAGRRIARPQNVMSFRRE